MSTNPQLPQSPDRSSITRVYLLIYNALCAALWLQILVTVIFSSVSSQDISDVYTSAEPWTRFSQTLAVAEVIHAACGITRSPVFTTFTQVFARSVQVWAVNYAFPEITSSSRTYGAMLLAWSTADVIRYSYFATMLAGFSNTTALKWLRYSLFVILYPVGIGSEWWLMYKAAAVTGSTTVAAIFYFCLGLYAPGSVMMYMYMLKQRRKVLAI